MSTLARLNGMLLAVWRGCADGQLGRLLFETDGQDVIEYALLTTFIGFAGAAAWNTMLTILGSVYAVF